VRDRVVILVDDGLATGSTMLAAVRVLREAKPARVIAAVPAAAPDTCQNLQSEVDEMMCLYTPDPFYAVGYGTRISARPAMTRYKNCLKKRSGNNNFPDFKTSCRL
jgi:putative phosphoribosyl transferase